MIGARVGWASVLRTLGAQKHLELTTRFHTKHERTRESRSELDVSKASLDVNAFLYCLVCLHYVTLRKSYVESRQDNRASREA